VLTNHAPADEKRLCKTKRDERKINDAAALGTNARSAGGALSRLLKNAPKCHPEVAPVFGEAKDDTLEEEFFSSLLGQFTKRGTRFAPRFHEKVCRATRSMTDCAKPCSGG
jgi:hypothetical protein